jgi:hypothetical protein
VGVGVGVGVGAVLVPCVLFCAACALVLLLLCVLRCAWLYYNDSILKLLTAASRAARQAARDCARAVAPQPTDGDGRAPKTVEASLAN